MLSKIGALSACGLLAATLAAAPAANAAVVIYSGYDATASNNATKPKADAAHAAFLAALAGHADVYTTTFEGGPLGKLPSYDMGGGGVLTGSDLSKNPQNVANQPLCQYSACGGNTTAGGKTYLSVNGGTVTFTFANGIDAFGAYFTGAQLAGLSLTFDDGAVQTVDVPGLFGADYVGFTDFGKKISKVTFNATRDQMALDDVTFAIAPAAAAVPEPATWALMIAGFGLAGASLRSRRRILAA